jgi:hypothetical protein
MNNGENVVKVLESIFSLLESKVENVSGTGYVSPQQPLGDLSQKLWHYRRKHYVGLHHVSLLFSETGPLNTISQLNGWANQFTALRNDFFVAFHALNRIRYHMTEEPVELGDHVHLRLFFKNRIGRVSYLPGRPVHNTNIDFNGLFSVGIEIKGGGFVAVHVDPDTLDLKKSVRFIKRDTMNIPEVPPESVLNE